MGPKNRPANEKKSYFCWSRKSWSFFLITLFMNMKNGTILLFSGSLSKICCTKLDLLQDIRKFYGALFDVHGFLKYERRHQSVAFNSLATQWVLICGNYGQPNTLVDNQILQLGCPWDNHYFFLNVDMGYDTVTLSDGWLWIIGPLYVDWDFLLPFSIFKFCPFLFSFSTFKNVCICKSPFKFSQWP